MFAYYSGFVIQLIPHHLLSRVEVSKCFVPTYSAFVIAALFSARSGLSKAINSISSLVSESLFFSIIFRGRNFVNCVVIFRIIGRCSFGASLAYLSCRRSEEGDWNCIRCLRWFRYMDQTDELINIWELQIPGKKRSLNGVLIIKALV